MTLSRFEQPGRARAGSQRQIQTYVNERPDVLATSVLKALPALGALAARLCWVSPLKQDSYDEYQDARFLKALGLEGWSECLKSFWPRGGPVWDALALAISGVDGGTTGVVMVEAKSYPGEMRGIGCRASEASRTRIETALAHTKQWLDVSAEYDWLGRLYQAANRLAHLYFLREIAHEPAWLVNICFVNDKRSPTSREEWQQALETSRAEMGLAKKVVPFTADIILDAIEELEPATIALLASKRDAILQLTARYGAHHVRLFGSAARGEATADSDIDVLVEFEPDRSLLDTIALTHALEDLLGRRVDVVTEQALHSAIRADVLKQAKAL